MFPYRDSRISEAFPMQFSLLCDAVAMFRAEENSGVAMARAITAHPALLW